MHRLKLGSAVVVLGLCVTGTAFAQQGTSSPAVSPTTTSFPNAHPAPAAAAPAPAPAPAAAAPAPAAAAPAPAPAAATAPSPAATAVPPGYKLVRVEEEQGVPQGEAQSPPSRSSAPTGRELPYEVGDPIPPGYRLREQNRRGLIIAGSIVTGIPWIISVTAATGADFENKSGYLLVPGIGPWLMLLAGGASDRSCDDTSGYTLCETSRAGLRAVLVFDGLVQSAGAAMFASGFLFPRQRLVRQDLTVSIAPTTLAPGAYGVGAVGTF